MTTPTAPRDRTPRWASLVPPRAPLACYRHTGGLVGHRLGPRRTLLLTTTGRKTGHPRTTPITYFRHPSGRLFLVASNWGGDNPPAWFLNLVADPHVVVQLKCDTFAATARPADPSERAELWPWLLARMTEFRRYQELAAREDPARPAGARRRPELTMLASARPSPSSTAARASARMSPCTCSS